VQHRLVRFDGDDIARAARGAPASHDETIIASGTTRPGGDGLQFDLGNRMRRSKSRQACRAGSRSSGASISISTRRRKQPAEPSAKMDLSDQPRPGQLFAETATVLATSRAPNPKWQEVATSSTWRRPTRRWGDKDGARELLKEVVKYGDAAQRGSAEQLLASSVAL